MLCAWLRAASGMAYRARLRGLSWKPDFRVYVTRDGRDISAWHHIPLRDALGLRSRWRFFSFKVSFSESPRFQTGISIRIARKYSLSCTFSFMADKLSEALETQMMI